MSQVSIWQPMPPTSPHDAGHPLTLQARNDNMGYAIISRSVLLFLFLQAFPIAHSQDQSPTGQLPASLATSGNSRDSQIGSQAGSGLIQSGGSKLLRMEDLPPGRFRSEMESLPPKIQKQALKRLAEIGVPLNDANSLHVDRTGMLFYACSPPSPSTTQQPPAPTPIKSN
jgi:hypothetical protein